MSSTHNLPIWKRSQNAEVSHVLTPAEMRAAPGDLSAVVPFLADPEKWRKRQWLSWRAHQAEPVQLCDDVENWPKKEKEITRLRKSQGQESLF
jgi:hypothetical protein